MIKVLFVCHGNTCRSPMAEFLFRDMVKKAGLLERFSISSAAAGADDAGYPISSSSREILEKNNFPYGPHRSRRVCPGDYAEYDYILIMDESNRGHIMRVFGGDPEGKVRTLLSFTDNPRDISDPWHTRDYQKAFDDIAEGCTAFLDWLQRRLKAK